MCLCVYVYIYGFLLIIAKIFNKMTRTGHLVWIKLSM